MPLRIPPLPADFIYTRICKLICAKFLTLPIITPRIMRFSAQTALSFRGGTKVLPRHPRHSEKRSFEESYPKAQILSYHFSYPVLFERVVLLSEFYHSLFCSLFYPSMITTRTGCRTRKNRPSLFCSLFYLSMITTRTES